MVKLDNSLSRQIRLHAIRAEPARNLLKIMEFSPLPGLEIHLTSTQSKMVLLKPKGDLPTTIAPPGPW